MFEYLEGLIHSDWAYVALFILTFLEGETILIIAGALAAESDAHGGGGLNVWTCMISAFLGSMAGDQTVFFITRRHADWMMGKIAKQKDKIDKVLAMLENNSTWLLLTFRFFYGFRNVVSIAVGLSRVSALKFVLLNALGSLIWANTFAFGGYFLGQAFGDILHRYLPEAIAGLLLVVAAVWMIKRSKRVVSAGTDLPTPPPTSGA
ncbi:MAG: DedA family protein [Planctomycetota bacterium]